MSRLKDKIILIPGGKGLLGRSIVEQVQREAGIAIVADTLASDNIESGEVRCDVTDEGSIREMLTSVHEHYGRIDGLVNAAYPHTADWGEKFENIKLQSWRSNVDMQLNSLFYLCQETLRLMKPRAAGSIVNMSSIYGMVAPDFSVYEGTQMTTPAAYAAIKAGVIHLTKYLAAYFGPYNIRINCLSPGGIFDNQHASFVANYEKKVPLRRMGRPDDIAGPVCFLLADESKYITGHNLPVDGGWTII